MSQYIFITPAGQQQLQSAYDLFILGANANPNHDIKSIFLDQVGTGNIAFGYSLTSIAFHETLGGADLEHVYVKFGYDPQSSNVPFKLIVYGKNAQNSIVTPIMLLDQPYFEFRSIQHDGRGSVPVDIAREWLWDYNGQISSTNFPVENMVLQSGEVLQGYTFPILDFSKPTRRIFNNIYFAFVVHGAAYPPNDPMPLGKLGLLIFTVGPDGNSLFYDISKPCPPTC